MGKICAAKVYFCKRRTKRYKSLQQLNIINTYKRNCILPQLFAIVFHQLCDLFLRKERSIWIKEKPNQGYWDRVLEKWQDGDYPYHLRVQK